MVDCIGRPEPCSLTVARLEACDRPTLASWVVRSQPPAPPTPHAAVSYSKTVATADSVLVAGSSAATVFDATGAVGASGLTVSGQPLARRGCACAVTCELPADCMACRVAVGSATAEEDNGAVDFKQNSVLPGYKATGEGAVSAEFPGADFSSEVIATGPDNTATGNAFGYTKAGRR